VVHEANPYYGVARFAIELGWTEKRARRIRNLSGITVQKRTKKRKSKSVKPEVSAPANALKLYADFKNSDRPQDGQSYARMTESGAWVQDFTYIWFKGM
jgi:transposase InsO family protein